MRPSTARSTCSGATTMSDPATEMSNPATELERVIAEMEGRTRPDCPCDDCVGQVRLIDALRVAVEILEEDCKAGVGTELGGCCEKRKGHSRGCTDWPKTVAPILAALRGDLALHAAGKLGPTR